MTLLPSHYFYAFNALASPVEERIEGLDGGLAPAGIAVISGEAGDGSNRCVGVQPGLVYFTNFQSQLTCPSSSAKGVRLTLTLVRAPGQYI